jgi:hypothetical protein
VNVGTKLNGPAQTCESAAETVYGQCPGLNECHDRAGRRVLTTERSVGAGYSYLWLVCSLLDRHRGPGTCWSTSFEGAASLLCRSVVAPVSSRPAEAL